MNINLDKAAAEVADFCWSRDMGLTGDELTAEIKAILAKHQVHHELEDQMPEPM
jgi:hypothetical protein